MDTQFKLIIGDIVDSDPLMEIEADFDLTYAGDGCAAFGLERLHDPRQHSQVQFPGICFSFFRIRNLNRK
jgi:hypothetical protein